MNSPKERVATLAALAFVFSSIFITSTSAQINTGSDGHDGDFSPTANIEVDMADHPDGIYHYKSVNIPGGVNIRFKPNARNTPVVWLVQESCVIGGQVVLDGRQGDRFDGGVGGPGGGAGGQGGPFPRRGTGFGGGAPAESGKFSFGGNASYGSGGATHPAQAEPGGVYGNVVLVPLLGGSGGGGSFADRGGGGGGGALLIAASSGIDLDGHIAATGAPGVPHGGVNWAGCGSGGAVRLVSALVRGYGSIVVAGGADGGVEYGGVGRIRIDALDDRFLGTIQGASTRGFQPIIFPAPGEGLQLAIASVAGISVPANPSAQFATPDVFIPSQRANPVPVVVRCSNIPMNTEITVEAKPANGPVVRGVGFNNAGTLASSTVTVSLDLPRGAGILWAKAVVGVGGGGGASASAAGGAARTAACGAGQREAPGATSYFETGLTAFGERFTAIEVAAPMGGPAQLTYVAASGARYPASR